MSIEAAVSSSSVPPTEAAWLATSTSTWPSAIRAAAYRLRRLRVGEVGLEVAGQPLAQRDLAAPHGCAASWASQPWVKTA